MTEEIFWKLVKRSPVFPKLISDPGEIRYQVGLMIGILDWHIPPDIRNQEHCPVLPLRFRAHEIKNPVVRKFVEESHEKTYQIMVIVWSLPL